MPSEEIIQDSVEGHAPKHGERNGYQKLFYLFRFRKKEKGHGKGRKRSSPDERRDQLERDMRNNWEELPATLKRRKEKLSQAVLAEFHNEGGNDPEHSKSHDHVKPVQDIPSESEQPSSFFIQDKDLTEINLDNDSTPNETHHSDHHDDYDDEPPYSTAKPSPKMVSPDNSQNKVLDVLLTEDSKNSQDESVVPPSCSFSSAIAAEELNLMELKQLKENLHQALSSATDLESALDLEQQHVIKLLSHAVSEDSLLIESSCASENSSSSSSSCEEERHHHDSGTDINSPSSSSSATEESPDTARIEEDFGKESIRNIKSNTSSKEPIICASQIELESNYSSSSSRERTADDVNKSTNTNKVESSSVTVIIENGSEYSSHLGDLSAYEDVASLMIPRAEYQSKDKGRGTSKSAEEDAMSYYDAVVEESSEIKTDDKDLCLKNESYDGGSASNTVGSKDYVSMEMKNKLYYNKNCDTKPVIKDTVIKSGVVKKHVAMEIITEENTAASILEEAEKLRFPTAVATKWKRPMSMETLNKKPKTMATIIEESSTSEETEEGSSQKLTVREILRRFEQLGGRMPPSADGEEKSATLREIQETLRCLEEKVRLYEDKMALQLEDGGKAEKLHQKAVPRISSDSFQHAPAHKTNSGALLDGWTGRAAQPQVPHHHSQPMPTSAPAPHVLQPHAGSPQQQGEIPEPAGQHDGKHSLLQFAMLHFRQSPEKFEMLKTADGSISGSLKVIESLKSKKGKSKKGNKENDWTWKEQVDLVKFSPAPIEQSLLRLESVELNELAVECFVSVMRYMGDVPMAPEVTEVKCVYTILMHCHKHESLRDEVYCQLMKQTTNNKSPKPDSCQRGWRLFSIVAAYFVCSDTLKPYLFKYLETAAYDKRRAYHGTATVCLQNLRKTFKYGGRKNVPSVEEITAISAGRNSKRQIYRLPGGTERVINTKSTTVVQDVIEEICTVINVQAPHEMEEFSLYCIVEGDTFTMPLAREEYILDVTTELHKNQQVFYLIFCRSVWHFPLRLDSHLYIEVVFNQIAPDYLEGLLLVMPGEQLDQDIIYDIAKMAALLHRAADMQHLPSMKETKFLLPKPALTVRDVKPAQWVNMVQGNWRDVEGLQTIQAKAQVLDILSKWPLFGSSFFAVKRVSDPKERSDHILALNRHGVHFIDLVTHETLIHYPFSEVISTRKVKSEDGTLFLDMKCGNLMQQRITRLQTDQAHEISRLIRQYITMEQRLRS